MQMDIQEKEKRENGSRSPTEAEVACRPFTNDAAADTVDAVMRNFSEKGCYIETFREFKLGTILHLRMFRYPSIQLSPGVEAQPPSVCLAEVKWRQELIDESSTQYGFGLKYLD
jgi:hypothetical protein